MSIMYLEIVQLSERRYFWYLMKDTKAVARSTLIDEKQIVIDEAMVIAKVLQIPVTVNERK